ncbi:MarC family protein [Methanosalsum natronophilum]|nr:MarC family protein [Methanosalsum natronophilum]MCS3924449.1 multiple antibiotic resistance protein [Methanosalsum natronophilum]
MDPIAFFIFSFVSLFVIVSPIGAVVIFISLTNDMTVSQKNRIAKQAVILAFFIATFFVISGETILNLFGISVDSLRVAGGILLFTIAFDMIQAKISRESVTEKEVDVAHTREDIWIFPIAMPMLVGPGTITTVIVLSGDTDVFYRILLFLAIALTFAIALLTLLFSRRIHRWIGYTGMAVIIRMLGLFLAAIAVDMISTGIWNIYSAM